MPSSRGRKKAIKASAHYTPKMGLPVHERALLVAGLIRLHLSSYAAYRSTAHWRRMIKRYRKKACEKCGGSYRLCLHHITYERLGRERSDDLCTLCSRCHTALHGKAVAKGDLHPGDLLRGTINLNAFKAQSAPKKKRRRRKRTLPKTELELRRARAAEFPLEATRKLRRAS